MASLDTCSDRHRGVRRRRYGKVEKVEQERSRGRREGVKGATGSKAWRGEGGKATGNSELAGPALPAHSLEA